MAGQALSGVKVADFTWVVAGPMTVKWLAEHGAEVIHVESSTRTDIMRILPPFKDGLPGLNRSAYHACFNDNKYGLALNMNHPRARDVLERLVKWADVVAENFSPGVMAKWGLAYEDLRRMKPGVILYSTSQQGQTGPRAKIAAMGTQLVSLSGFTHLTGWPDRDPAGPYGPYTDSLVPTLGAAGIMAALINRRKTGKGCHLELSQLEAAVNFLSPALLDYAVNGRIAIRQGNRCDYACPQGVYPCSGEDRWCAISVVRDHEWERLCHVMGKPELSKDPAFATLPQRKKNADALDGIISDWTSERSAEDVMRTLQEAGIAAGIAQTSKDLLENDPQLAHRHFFWDLEHREIGRHRYGGAPVRLSKTPSELTMPGPCIGEHNEHVCRKMLGFSEEEYASLVADGVLE